MQERLGSRLTLAPCEEDGLRQNPHAQWRVVWVSKLAGFQLQNAAGLCVDLEHQHRHGALIQWTCKTAFNYKSTNQIFNWVE